MRPLLGTPCVVRAGRADVVLRLGHVGIRAHAVHGRAVWRSRFGAGVPSLGIVGLGQARVGADDHHVNGGGLKNSLGIAFLDAEAGTLDGDTRPAFSVRDTTHKLLCQSRGLADAVRNMRRNLGVERHDVAHGFLLL